MTPPCKGMNCQKSDANPEHSLECEAQHAAAIAGGHFVKGNPMTKTIDALVEALEAMLEHTASFDANQGMDDSDPAAVQQAAAALSQARAEQAEPMPPWLSYEPSQDVLTINGKRYSAALFGVEGFLAPAGTCLRIVDGPNEVVTAEKIPPAAPVAKLEPLTDAEIRVLLPLGGSWFDFARAIEAAHNAKLNDRCTQSPEVR